MFEPPKYGHELNAQISQIFRERLNELGWSQAEFARKLRVSPSMVSAYLRDDGHRFSLGQIDRFSQALEITVNLTRTYPDETVNVKGNK